MHVGAGRLDGRRARQVASSRLPLLLRPEKIAAVQERVKIPRIDFQGRIQAGNRIVHLSQASQGQTFGDMGARKPGLQCGHELQFVFRPFILVEIAERDGEVVMGERVAGIHLERRCEVTAGLVILVNPLQGQAKFDAHAEQCGIGCEDFFEAGDCLRDLPGILLLQRVQVLAIEGDAVLRVGQAAGEARPRRSTRQVAQTFQLRHDVGRRLRRGCSGECRRKGPQLLPHVDGGAGTGGCEVVLLGKIAATVVQLGLRRLDVVRCLSVERLQWSGVKVAVRI